MMKSSRNPAPAIARGVVVSLLLAAAPVAADVRIEAGGGAFVPYDQDHREVYGSSPSFGAGISSALGENGARVFLDLAHVRGSGDELDPDPTFEGAGDTEYRLWPVTLGVRLDLNRTPDQDLRLFLGFGFRTVFTHWEGAGRSGSSPTFGGLVELRPEYRAGDRWTVWLRQRLDVLRDASYGIPWRALDYSASTLEAGLSFGLDDAPLTPPRVKP